MKPEDTYIIFGCEESQACTIEFRKLGFKAFSCDIKICSGGHPEWHLPMDIFKAINLKKLKTQSGENIFILKWDMGVFFPDCTYLTVSANKWYKDQPSRKSGVLVGKARRDARVSACKFFMALWNCKISKIAIENPIGVMSTYFRKPDQVIQPWMFGHGETKATCLWLNNLPKLIPENIVEGREHRIHKLKPSSLRAEIRSKTFLGIAKAMANSWGKYLIENGK